MIALDTSVLIDALTGPRRSGEPLRALIEAGERVVLPTLVLYEWLRGPRTVAELDLQEALFPTTEALPFGVQEAAAAARLYDSVSDPRGREVDIAIAACAVVHDAAVWTHNVTDFEDLPGLELWKVPPDSP